jgi:hypothetical protein
MNMGPYLDYLREKYGALYRLPSNMSDRGRDLAAARHGNQRPSSD